MRNRMLIILGSIIVLFVALYVVVDYKNKQSIEHAGNPYGKDSLKQETIDQLDDPNYQNQITPEDLEERLENEEDIVVYFYSPICVYCLETTPTLVSLEDELGLDIRKFNVYEFGEHTNTYNIPGTPILVYYENGKEVDRVKGAESEATFRQFFKKYVLAKE